MLAILSDSIENAGRLSENLQYYWNAQGVYTSVSLYENESEFLQAIATHTYKSAILNCSGNLIGLIQQVRTCNPTCKIAVLVNSSDFTEENEIAFTCRLGVEMVLARSDLEKPLEMLSKQLCVL